MFTFLFFKLRQINVTKMRAARAAQTYSIIVFAVFIFFFVFSLFLVLRAFIFIFKE